MKTLRRSSLLLLCALTVCGAMVLSQVSNAKADDGPIGHATLSLGFYKDAQGSDRLTVSVVIEDETYYTDVANNKRTWVHIEDASGKTLDEWNVIGPGGDYIESNVSIMPSVMYKVSVMYTRPPLSAEQPRNWVLAYSQITAPAANLPSTPPPAGGGKSQEQLNCEKDGGVYKGKGNCDYAQAKANCTAVGGTWNGGAVPGSKCQYDSTPFAKIDVSVKAQSKDTVAVSWQPVSGVTEYSVKWQQQDKADVYGSLSVNFASNAKISGLQPATSYTVTVTAKKDGKSVGYGITTGSTLSDPTVKNAQCKADGGIPKEDGTCDGSECIAGGGSWDFYKVQNPDGNGYRTGYHCTSSDKAACEKDTGSGKGVWTEYHDSMGGKSVTSWSCDYSAAKTTCSKDSNRKWDDSVHKCSDDVAAIVGSCNTKNDSVFNFFSLPTWYKYLKMNKVENSKTHEMACEPVFCVLSNVDENGDVIDPIDANGKRPGDDGYNERSVRECSSSSIPLVILALIEIVLRIGSIVAVAFVVVGGIKFVTSQGEPEGVKNARSTIMNALIGLAITLVATPIIGFIGNKLGG